MEEPIQEQHLEIALSPDNGILQRTITNFRPSKLFKNCSGGGPDAPPTRVYHVWPGKNVFFFRGRMICGPDPRGLILTAMSVALSGWILSVYVSDAPQRHSVLMPASSMALTATVIVTLVLTATMDPGIIPRSGAPPPGRAGSRRICIGGVETRVKYCRICRILRLPRSSHCAVCDNCVEKFDHHCPWIGQCIGLRNYRCYLVFISSALAFYVYALVVSLRRLRIRMSSDGAGVAGLVRFVPETFALAVFSLIAIWFLGCLLAFHVFLLAKNQTSHERYKQRYENSTNPYDKGLLSNIREGLLAKLPPSRVDFRAVVEPNQGTAERTMLMSCPNFSPADSSRIQPCNHAATDGSLRFDFSIPTN